MRLLHLIVTVNLLVCPLALTTAELANPAPPQTSAAQLAFDTFTALFEDEANPLPRNVRVLGTRIRDGVLTVNISEDILIWGGNENEKILIAMLKETALAVPGATRLTLLIEGEVQALAEGRMVEEAPLASLNR
jgi:hypothetical protein